MAAAEDAQSTMDAEWDDIYEDGNENDTDENAGETVYEQDRDELFIGCFLGRDELERLLSEEAPDIWVDQDVLETSPLTVGRCGSCISYYQNRQEELKGHKIRIENGGGIHIPQAVALQSDFTELIRGSGSVNGK